MASYVGKDRCTVFTVSLDLLCGCWNKKLIDHSMMKNLCYHLHRCIYLRCFVLPHSFFSLVGWCEERCLGLAPPGRDCGLGTSYKTIDGKVLYVSACMYFMGISVAGVEVLRLALTVKELPGGGMTTNHSSFGTHTWRNESITEHNHISDWKQNNHPSAGQLALAGF